MLKFLPVLLGTFVALAVLSATPTDAAVRHHAKHHVMMHKHMMHHARVNHVKHVRHMRHHQAAVSKNCFRRGRC